MSSSSSYKVYVDLILNSKGFDTKISQVQSGFDKVKKQAQDTGDNGEAHIGKLSGALGKIGTVAKGAALAGIAAVGAGIVKISKDAISAIAEFEQVSGGVETLFKDSANIVFENADKAFKSAGLSANAYMEQATSYASRLLRDTGGNSKRAAELVDMAITDMADNANKMGTPLDMIKNAYEGLAKGNATMLDNLKIGYGGTQTEMLKLAKDMGVVEDSVQSFADMTYEEAILAIHKLQEELGITGTTAEEAEHTISGSVSMLKASWTNLLTSFGQGDGEKVKKAVQDVLDSAMKVFENVMPYLPMIIDGITQLIEGVMNFLSNDENRQKIEDALTKLFTALVPVIVKLATMAVKILWDTLFNTVVGLFTWAQNLGQDLGKSLAQGIKNAARTFVEITAFLWNTISSAIAGWFGRIWSQGSQLVSNMANGIRSAAGAVWNAITGAVSGAVNAVRNFFGAMISAGSNIVSGLVQGIANGAGAVIEKVKEIASGALDAIKSFFGIHSPSKVMANMGSFLMQGFEQGIEKSARGVYSAISEVSDGMMNRFNPSLTAGVSGDFSALNNVPLNPAFASTGQASVATVKQYNTINTPVDLQIMNQKLGNAVRRATA